MTIARPPVYLVCGFGRCGTSAMMQMLDAGGVPATGEYPTFEGRPPPHQSGADWWPAQAGRAVKRLAEAGASYDDDLLAFLGTNGLSFRAIWLDRDPKQQAASAYKFMKAFIPRPMWVEPGRGGRRALAASYRADRPRYIRRLVQLCAEPPLVLTFEDMLARPESTARFVQSWVGRPLNVDAMARTIVQRPPTSYRGFLEVELMEARFGQSARLK